MYNFVVGMPILAILVIWYFGTDFIMGLGGRAFLFLDFGSICICHSGDNSLRNIK